MQHSEEIEMQVWDYIDGRCDEQGQKHIAQLIATNNTWKLKFDELSALHNHISANVELEQPSMRFSQNVMDVIAQTSIAPVSKKFINKYIIGGIAAVFIIAIGILLVFSLSVPQQSNSTYQLYIKQFQLDSFLNTNTISLFIFTNIIIGLILIDTLLRKKHASKI